VSAASDQCPSRGVCELHDEREPCSRCPDPCVVESAPVATIIASFVQRWRDERPSRKNRWNVPNDEAADGDVEPVAPYTFLAVDTGLASFYAKRAGRSEPTASDVHAAEETLRKARNSSRNRYVELRVADAIVASIGDPGMFSGDDPQLVILPNPKAPASRHGECCGGSLTGA
jgi:hypothetical protein